MAEGLEQSIWQEQERRQPASIYWWPPVAVGAIFLLAFETNPGPTQIALTTVQPPAPTVPTLIMEPVIIETASESDPEARFILNIFVLDENERPTRATITITWLQNEFPANKIDVREYGNGLTSRKRARLRYKYIESSSGEFH